MFTTDYNCLVGTLQNKKTLYFLQKNKNKKKIEKLIGACKKLSRNIHN